MSRSYKRYPQWTDGGPHNYGKRKANKAVRARQRQMLERYEKGNMLEAESLELDDGSDFKNVFESYEIRDFSFVHFNASIDMSNDFLRKGITK